MNAQPALPAFEPSAAAEQPPVPGMFEAAPPVTRIEVPQWFEHPLLQLFRPAVATPSIELLADAIHAAIDMGYRGLGVYGFARFGKTEALAYLCNRRDWLGSRGAAVLRLDAPDARKRNDSTFFQSLLTLLRVTAPTRGNTDQLCALVMGHLIEQALAADSRLVIVFIDEAQRLRPSDYENLVTLDNRMTQAGFYFFAVFVHQRDITGFTNLVVGNSEHPPHVFGRFMVRRHEFTGLRGVEDVAFVLMRYDEGSEWPAGSGTSHTAHFAEEAFRDEGFRLVKYAQLLWDTAAKLRSQERLAPDWTWPMKSFEAAVVYLLTVNVRRNLGVRPLTLSESDIVEALCHAQLVELEKSRVTYKPQTNREGT